MCGTAELYDSVLKDNVLTRETKCKVADMWLSYLKLVSSFFIKRMILESTVSNHRDGQNQTVGERETERENAFNRNLYS